MPRILPARLHGLLVRIVASLTATALVGRGL
jgi:hypothetical protein